MDWVTITIFVFASLRIITGSDIEITSFSQSSEAVREGESMTFSCGANADEAEWRIDGYPRHEPGNTQQGYTIDNSYSSTRNPQFILSLTMWGGNNNGREILCYAASAIFMGHYLINRGYFRIAERPLPPAIDIVVEEGGTRLNVSWEEPDYYPSHPITGYTLEMENQSTSEAVTLLHHTRALSHVVSLDEVASACHQLNFSVTAHSVLGNVTNHRLGTFPRVPKPLNLSVELSFSSDLTPSLSILATFTDPCVQEGNEYSISVHKHGQIVTDTLRSTLNDDFTLGLEVSEGLSTGFFHAVVATGSNIAGSSSLEETIHITVSLNYGNGCSRNLTAPPNSRFRIEDISILLAIYTCDDGSQTIRYCLANTSWSGTEPFCKSINCNKDLASPPRGNVTITDSPTGLVAVYQCEDGTVQNRTCLPNTSWSQPVPECPEPPSMIITAGVQSSEPPSMIITTDAQSSEPPSVVVTAGIQSSDLNTLLIVVLAALLGIVVGVIVTVISIVGCCLYRRRKKTLSALAVSRIRQPPSSIPLHKSEKSATNPIYEGGGPIYDSPSEPFKSLLSMSTPSTPTPTTPSISPRYFDMPPKLPAPRKTSVCYPQSPPPSATPSLDQVERIQSSFNAAVPPVDDAYTIMKPVPSKGLSRPNKPSPLVIPNSINLNTQDEYVTIS